MKLFKTLILTLITTSIIWFWFGIDFYYDYNDVVINDWKETEIWYMIQSDVVNDEWSVLNRLLSLFNLSQQSRYDSGTSKAIYYAKMIVNMMLSFVSFIALVMLIYAFYMMFFSKEESGMTKAKQVLKWVIIALIIMWLSRFIVSLIFWIQSSSANNTSSSSSSVSASNSAANISSQASSIQ